MKKVISFLLTAAMLLSMVPAVFAEASKQDSLPPMQAQEDFTYLQEIKNTDGTQSRFRSNLDCNWRFVKADPADAQAVGFDDSAWRLLNLPHDWSAEGEYSRDNPSGGGCGYLPGGIGWYRKTLTVPAQWRDGRRVSIEFDGVFRNSKVYANGQLLGERPYGWISFAYDLTDHIGPDGTVEIAVRVDNSLEPAARWYTGSGIYAHVWLLSTAPTHIARYEHYVTTPEVAMEADGTAASAKVQVQSKVVSDTASQVTLRSTVLDAEGKPVAEVLSPAVTAGPEGTVVTQTLELTAPQLWDTEHPYLYKVHTEVLSDGVQVDDCITRFGVRTLRYTPDQGFFLNNQNIKLKGAADHWAMGALGAAVPESILRDRLQLLKDMGLNAIRTSHNPRPPMFYDLCDEYGILVMDEIFDGWHRKATHDYGAHSFAQWWKTDTADWVRRDRNHPCVILWSIGNETGGKDINGICSVIKQYDTTRATTGGSVSVGVDVVGTNGGSESPGFRQPDPTRPFVATEAPHTWQVRNMYETQTWYRDGLKGNVLEMPNMTENEIFQYDWAANVPYKRGFQSSYDNAYVRGAARYNWTMTRDNPWRMGEFRWTAFDYLGEASYVSGGWPYKLFTSGAIDCANFPKDLYYLYQSMWVDVEKAPMVHILPSWTHPIMEKGTEIPVWVYSNCEIVELFLNGQSLGKLNRGDMNTRPWDQIQFDWMVPWTPGTLKAVGYAADGVTVLAQQEYATAGVPAKLQLSAGSNGKLPVDAGFVDQITVKLTDEKGNFYPYGENRTYYHVDGPAYIRAVDNGSPVDVQRHFAVNNRNAFMGLNKVYLQATQEPGDILFTAGSILGEKKQLTSNLVSIDVQQLAVRGNPAKHAIEIYYTTDGTAPSKTSARYTGSFSVPMETTVRAAVYADGQKILDMQERFTVEEGLYWKVSDSQNSAVRINGNVYPAEYAKLSGTGIHTVDSTVPQCRDKYVDFGNQVGSVSFQLTDCRAGDYYMGIRYNSGYANSPGTTTKKLKITVNATDYGYSQFEKTGEWETSWAYRLQKVTLEDGKNTVLLTVDSNCRNGVNLDEIVFWPAETVLAPDSGTWTATEGAVIREGANGGAGAQYADFPQTGNVSLPITVEEDGVYPVTVLYASDAAQPGMLELSVDGTSVGKLPADNTLMRNGQWELVSFRAVMLKGQHTLTIRSTAGNAVSAVICGETERPDLTGLTPAVINVSCADHLRLGISDGTACLVSTDLLAETAQWYLLDTDDASKYLYNSRLNRYLSYDGQTLELTSLASENAKWNINGDREFFDYIQHAKTSRRLGAQDGRLVLYAASYGTDEDFQTNMAYWAIHTVDPQQKLPSEVAAQIGTLPRLTREDQTVKLPEIDPAFALSIRSASNPNLIEQDGTVHWPDSPCMVHLVLQVRRNSDGSTAPTRELTLWLGDGAPNGQDIYVYQAEDAHLEGSKIIITTPAPAEGRKAVDFNNAPGKIVFQLHDCPAGSYRLGIRYNNGKPNNPSGAINTKTVWLHVNDSPIQSRACGKTGNWNIDWGYQFFDVTLHDGTNTVTVEARSSGVNVDVIKLWPADTWQTASADWIHSAGNAMKTDADGAMSPNYYDLAPDQTLSAVLNVPADGQYTVGVVYSSAADGKLSIRANDGTAVQASAPKTFTTNHVWNTAFVKLQLKQGENRITVASSAAGAVNALWLSQPPVPVYHAVYSLTDLEADPMPAELEPGMLLQIHLKETETHGLPETVQVKMGGQLLENVYADGVITIPVVTGNVEITAAGVQKQPASITVSAVNMTLGNTLDMNLMIDQADVADLTGLSLQITGHHTDGHPDTVVTVPADQWNIYNESYCVTFHDIAAKEMTDTVTALVLRDGQPAGKEYTDSVEAYALRLLRKADTSAALKALIVDLLNYGTAAQQYFTYHLSAPANGRLTPQEQALASSPVNADKVQVKGPHYYGSNMTLGSNMALTLYFADITPDMHAEITYTKHNGRKITTQVPGSDFIVFNRHIYGIRINTLVVADAQQPVTVTVYDGETVIGSATDSIADYISRSEKLHDLGPAILRFSASAQLYFAER